MAGKLVALAVASLLIAGCSSSHKAAPPHPTSTAPRTAPAPDEAPLGATKDRPAPIGTAVHLPAAQWSVTVLSVNDDAARVVLPASPSNQPPGAGQQYVLARLRMTYEGQGMSAAAQVALDSAGASDIVYSAPNYCGAVVPDDITRTPRVLAGGTVEGNVCWSVNKADVATLVLVASLQRDQTVLSFLALH